MDPFTAILTIISVARQVEGGIQAALPLIATLHAGGVLSDDQIAKIKSDGAIADAEYDTAIAAAKQRIGVK